MKRFLTFIPLGVGISSAIIYVFNIISFRAINNTVAMSQILSNLRIYLYISIIGFVVYAILKILFFINGKKEPKKVIVKEPKEKVIKVKVRKREVKPVTVIHENDTYVPNYDYVPLYENKDEKVIEEVKDELIEEEPVAYEPFDVVPVKAETKKEEKISVHNNYCPKCGNETYDGDIYCRSCGYNLENNKKHKSSFVRKVINVIEIIIMILVIYFILNMLVEYKHSINPNFKSPFNITMTK